jgi:predicted lipid-binding transport protein (Tim44 family)
MAKRYSALRTIGAIYRVFGIIVGVLTALAAIGVCLFSILAGASAAEMAPRIFGVLSGAFGGVLGAVAIIIYGGLIAVGLYAFGEAVEVFLALEENTRLTAESIRALFPANRPAPAASPAQPASEPEQPSAPSPQA